MPGLNAHGAKAAQRRAEKAEERVKDLEDTMLRLAALLYAYNAEKPDTKIVALAEIARKASGEAAY